MRVNLFLKSCIYQYTHAYSSEEKTIYILVCGYFYVKTFISV